MSKSKQGDPDPDLRDECEFSRGVRGKYAKRFADSASVNEALRSFLDRGRVKPSGA